MEGPTKELYEEYVKLIIDWQTLPRTQEMWEDLSKKEAILDRMLSGGPDYMWISAEPKCEYCEEVIRGSKIHECMTFVNGIPCPGLNHLKTPWEMKLYVAKAYLIPKIKFNFQPRRIL